VLGCTVSFAYRRGEWAERVQAGQAVAYRIHLDAGRGRWYLTAAWQNAPAPPLPMSAALARGVAGVDTNADHFAAYRLDVHGNPMGNPRRFYYDLTGSAEHRDAQVRHAITRLLHWAKRGGAIAIGIEDLDFAAEKTREKHGSKRRFRQLISGMPTGRLRARLTSMAARAGISIIAADPAYTSKWGTRRWGKLLSSPRRRLTRHDTAGVAIGRRALGHPIRRRTAPPPVHQSDEQEHRTAQAEPGALGCEGTRPPATDPPPGGRPPNGHVNAGDQRAKHRSWRAAEREDPLTLS
jgi:IS605 OrfB family transposase